MKCDICAESNVGLEHEISEKHIRNKVLFEYSQNRKQFYGNRKGVVVTCNVKSSVSSFVDNTDAKIKISAKPQEELTFKFTVKNECNKENIVVIFIQTAHNKLNFAMSKHGLEFGCSPVTLKPKEVLQKEIWVTFKSSDIGQYEMPIIFSFRKPLTNEGVLVMRDMVVYVEEQKRTHEKIDSPYTKKEVKANKLFHSTVVERSDDLFRIPKNYKPIYGNKLRVNKDAPKEQRQLCEDLKEIFAAGVTKENYVRFFHNLLWYEETIVRINLKNYNMSNVPLRAQGDTYALFVPGLAEKRPSIMMGDIIFVKPHNNDEVMFEGSVTDISGENVVSIRGLHPEFAKYYSYGATFDVRFFLSRMTLERMHRAVQHMVSGHPDQCRVFPERAPKPRHIPPIAKFYNPLVEANEEQRRAVEHIVAGSSYGAPYLLHGPPGTGKTVTIVEAILQIVTKSPKNRVLVCTDSNMAADHVATLIIKYIKEFDEKKLVKRASSKFRVWETLPVCLQAYSNGTSRDNFEPVNIYEFQTYNIVITTLSHAAKFAKELSCRRMEHHITHLFIDEAAQASEPSALIPVSGLLQRGGLLVLAGDPLQLGPVVISKHADRLGLGLSLMERLKNSNPLYSGAGDSADPHYTMMLRRNFRSDPDILDIPNDIFYHGKLLYVAECDPISKVDILGTRSSSRAIVFHGVLSKEQRMGKSPSFFNTMELEIVQKYVRALIFRLKVPQEDIGIVTPYIRQVYKVKQWLEHQSLNSIEVGTVEAFQGKEKRIIIISTVRANASLLDHDARYQLGFLVDDKRFNVALTRAKAKAIIIGNPLCLERDAKWRAYMNKCREFGTYFGYDTKEQTDVTRQDIVNKMNPILNNMKQNKPKKG